MRFRLVLFPVGLPAILPGLNMLPAVAWGVYCAEYAAVGDLLRAMAISIAAG